MVRKKLIGYLKVDPRPSDAEVGIWAKRHGYSVDKVDDDVYRITRWGRRRKHE